MAKKKKTVSEKIKHPGSLTRAADAAGESLTEFARAHYNDSGKMGEKSRYYLNVLKSAHHPKHR